jgi:hypothetical protein
MTDVAQRVASKRTEHPEPSSSTSPGKLKIEGLHPRKVHVEIFDQDGVLVAGFASEPTGTYYTDGIEWEYKLQTELAMFVGFVLADNVARLSCDELSYSKHYDADPVKQEFCIPPAPTSEPVTYHFNVYPSAVQGTANPPPIDPQIVVTPIASM